MTKGLLVSPEKPSEKTQSNRVTGWNDLDFQYSASLGYSRAFQGTLKKMEGKDVKEIGSV